MLMMMLLLLLKQRAHCTAHKDRRRRRKATAVRVREPVEMLRAWRRVLGGGVERGGVAGAARVKVTSVLLLKVTSVLQPAACRSTRYFRVHLVEGVVLNCVKHGGCCCRRRAGERLHCCGREGGGRGEGR